MTVLVYVEHHDGAFNQSSLGVLSKGRELATDLGGDLVAVVAGSGVGDLAASLGSYGPTKVLVADDARFGAPVAAPLVDVVVAAVEASGARYVLSSAGVLASEVMGGVAGRLGVGINTDGTGAEVRDGSLVFRRPALDDTVVVECSYQGAGDGLQGIALFRANSFQPATANGSQAAVEPLTVADSGRRAAEFRGSRSAGDEGGVDITQADVLVAAGRGLGSPDRFDVVESLAKALGGAVATTRAVVDAGWYDYSTQVGQTGKTVAPKLYIAVGISGAIQHKIGMQNSGTIVAINKDPNAPIFEYADFGVVGDLFQVVPKLEEEIRNRKGGA